MRITPGPRPSRPITTRRRPLIDAGIAAKKINPANAECPAISSRLKAKPKATAADLAAAHEERAQSGMALLRIGDRYYAMGDYAKAVELYRMAMSKPGVDRTSPTAHRHGACARGRQGGRDAALNSVTGPRAEIAKFWLTYLNQQA